MNKYHNLISKTSQDEEPRWVTKCLDGFNLNDRSIEAKKNENSFSKLLNNLFPRREGSSRPPEKPVRAKRGLVSGEGELSRAADEIYNDILQTVQLQAPPRPRKGIIKGKQFEGIESLFTFHTSLHLIYSLLPRAF